MNNYFERYKAWRDQQVCIGCQRKHEMRGDWITEYLCTPCWESGVRGEPPIMFDGYSGTTYPTRRL